MAVLVYALMSVSACARLDDTSRVKRDISEKWFWQPVMGSYFTSFIFFLPSHIWFHLFPPYLCISIHLGPKQGCLGAAGWNQCLGGHEDINAFFNRLKARKTLLHSEAVQGRDMGKIKFDGWVGEHTSAKSWKSSCEISQLLMFFERVGETVACEICMDLGIAADVRVSWPMVVMPISSTLARGGRWGVHGQLV